MELKSPTKHFSEVARSVLYLCQNPLKLVSTCNLTLLVLRKSKFYFWFLFYFILTCINNDTKANEQKGMRNTTRIYPWATVILIYVDDLPSASNLLNTIMFADDINLFFEHKDMSFLFSTVNRELQNINEWFISSKLSLNV